MRTYTTILRNGVVHYRKSSKPEQWACVAVDASTRQHYIVRWAGREDLAGKWAADSWLAKAAGLNDKYSEFYYVQGVDA